MPAEHTAGFGSPRALIGALAWRTRQEGVRYLLVGFVPFALATTGLVVSLFFTSAANGAGTFASYAAGYGAHADTVAIGEVLIQGPGLVAVCSAIAAGLIVRNLIGSEASRGGIEALLAGPYRPRSIMTALLGYVGALAACYRAAMSVTLALILMIVTWTSGAMLSLTTGYLLLVLILPLLAAWDATGLSLLVNLLYPRLAQAGSIGLNKGGGGLGTGAALLPALGVFLVFTLWAPHISPGGLLAIAGSATAVIAVGSTAVVAHRFRPDAILES